MTDERLAKLINFYETLSPTSLSTIYDVYATDVDFKDPFNHVQGVAKVEAIFAHMFLALQNPRFKVQDSFFQGDQAFMSWDFHFERKGLPADMSIHGASHILFGVNGKVQSHRDYWDAANELYIKLPVVGGPIRWLAKQFATPN